MVPNRGSRWFCFLVSRFGARRSRRPGGLSLLAAGAVATALGACGDRGTGDGRAAASPAGRVVAAAAGVHPYTHLRVEGPPRWMGLEEGRLLRDPIRAAVAQGASRPDVAGSRVFLRPVRALLPADVEEELQGIAEGAGVAADDLFLLEVAREGRRWQGDAPGLLEMSFACAPGAGSPLVVAVEGLGTALLPEPLVVIERHPMGGTSTLSLSWAGGLGALCGVSARGLAAGLSEVDVPAERRSIKGLPMAIALRLGLELADGPAALLAALPRLSGHRVVAAGPDGRRASALLSLVVEPPETFDAQAWLLVAAGPRAPSNPRTLALERRLAGHAGRPGASDAVDLAVAGRSPSAVGPVVLLSGGGILVRTGVGPSGMAPLPSAASYAWADDRKLPTK